MYCKPLLININLLGYNVNVWVKSGIYGGVNGLGLAVIMILFYLFYAVIFIRALTTKPWMG